MTTTFKVSTPIEVEIDTTPDGCTISITKLMRNNKLAGLSVENATLTQLAQYIKLCQNVSDEDWEFYCTRRSGEHGVTVLLDS